MSSDPKASTLEYYRVNAEEFVEGTKGVDVSELYAPFLELLPPNASILDAGCGSGRDTKYFIEQGFKVIAFDYSPEIVRLASSLTKQSILQLSFEDITFCNQFDGVWACASLLHVPKKDMAKVLSKLGASLKVGGILYTSYKYGESEMVRGGRLFADYTEESFGRVVAAVLGLEVVKYWKTSDLRPGREDEKWLNVLLRKFVPMRGNLRKI